MQFDIFLAAIAAVQVVPSADNTKSVLQYKHMLTGSESVSLLYGVKSRSIVFLVTDADNLRDIL